MPNLTATTARYAAKAAYQLALMRGIYESTIAGCSCDVRCVQGFVIVIKGDARRVVPIAKAWASL